MAIKVYIFLNEVTQTPIVTDCCNNQEFLRNSQKRILIYYLEKREQSVEWPLVLGEM